MSTPTPDPRLDELHDLIDASCDDALTPEQADRLNALLLDDPVMQDAYLAYVQVDGFARWQLGRPNAPGASADLAGRIEPTVSARRFPRALAFAAAACLLIGATVALVLSVSSPSGSDAGASAPVAVVIDAADTAWRSDPVQIGVSVEPGRFALDAGMVQLELHSGVTLTLLAPVDFTLTSDMGGELSAGRVLALVGPGAAGFTVRTPDTRVVDLGTEFGVEVTPDAGTRVHVFRGRVELRGDRTVGLDAGQAADVRVGAQVGTPTPDLERFIYRRSPIPTHLHLAFDGDLRPRERDDLTVTELPTPGAIGYVERAGGRAARFDGAGAALLTDHPGVNGSAARTVAMWVRIPADAEPDGAYALTAWGLHGGAGAPGAKWQIAWNKLGDQGRVGALRCEVNAGYVIGTTDLRDGAWHHVAVVYPGREEHEGHAGSGAIRLYVDGVREPITGVNDVPVDTRGPDRGGSAVVVGRFLNGSTTLHADIDDLFVIAAPLDAPQINTLMETADIRRALVQP